MRWAAILHVDTLIHHRYSNLPSSWQCGTNFPPSQVKPTAPSIPPTNQQHVFINVEDTSGQAKVRYVLAYVFAEINITILKQKTLHKQ